MIWTPALDKALIALIASGVSTTRAEVVLGMTRNALIGRARRLRRIDPTVPQWAQRPSNERSKIAKAAAKGRSRPTVDRRIDIKLADLPPRVNRDPCFRCGVRADIGCEHTRAAA